MRESFKDGRLAWGETPALPSEAPAIDYATSDDAGARPFAPIDIGGDDIPFIMEWR